MEDSLFICNSEITIQSHAINADQYLWNTNTKTKDIIISSAGKYWVTAMNKRCQATDTVFVIETDIPDFEIQTSGDLCEDGRMELYVDMEMENLSYHWSTGDTTDNITVFQDGVYGIVVSLTGCTTLQNINVKCPCGFWIPNTFTPNGDSINDYFLPEAKSVLSTFLSMFIYDRWGNVIFQTDTYIPWYGTDKNKEDAMPGIYTYVICYTCHNKPNTKQWEQGHILLTR
jgi:gliding motility-associated-like protein